MAEDQRLNRWDADKYSHAFVELSGSTMGILALGDIGKAVARRAYGFDIDVYAVDINPVAPPPQVKEVWGLERLDELMQMCDWFVVTAPLTAESRGLIDARRIGLLKPSSYLIVISRGGIVDEDALADALQSGAFSGRGHRRDRDRASAAGKPALGAGQCGAFAACVRADAADVRGTAADIPREHASLPGQRAVPVCVRQEGGVLMRVLIADRFSDAARASLITDGVDVRYAPDARDDDLTNVIANARPDVLVVRSTRINADMLRAGKIMLVIRAGAGFNTIDVETAKSLGIFVANCPGKNSNAVAEIAFGLIIALDRQILANTLDLHRGVWRKASYSGARGLAGSTLGLVGVGRIGRAMIPRAKAFGMAVVGWSRSLTDDAAAKLGIERKYSPLDVAKDADIVSLHVALTGDTREIAGPKFFESMREGAIFINTARAEVVDESALAWAVQERGIRAGLDVFEGEPPSGTGEIYNPLFALEGVIGTHHIGGQTSESQGAIADETVRIIREFRATGTPPNFGMVRGSPIRS